MDRIDQPALCSGQAAAAWLGKDWGWRCQTLKESHWLLTLSISGGEGFLLRAPRKSCERVCLALPGHRCCLLPEVSLDRWEATVRAEGRGTDRSVWCKLLSVSSQGHSSCAAPASLTGLSMVPAAAVPGLPRAQPTHPRADGYHALLAPASIPRSCRGGGGWQQVVQCSGSLA